MAVAFLLLHLPYLPASLEDVDSINFALGVRHFDVAHHQPHPPGYPLFILIAKGVRLLVGPEARALALAGVVAGALGVVAIAALFRRLDDDPRVWLAGTAVAIAAPLYWFTANRPLSDMTGLAAAIAVQVVILDAATPRALAGAAWLAAFAVGLRSQVFWLTAPLLIAANPKSRFRTALAYIAGLLLWAVPLIVAAGGPRVYWHAVFDQGAEDLSGIRMLWTTPTVHELVDAVYYAFVAPWALWLFATVVLALAACGAFSAARRQPRTLALVAIAFGPYLLFDLLFQETFTSRYALPLVVPVAFFAAAGARALPRTIGTAIAIGLAMFGAHVGGTSLAAYSRQPAPAFRLLGDMARETHSMSAAPAVGMDRREALDLRRPAAWIDGAMPHFAEQLPSPPQHEWLEPVRYWVRGGRGPLWFVADPNRTDIDLIQHGPPQRYRWGLPYPVLIDGVRPSEMDWYELDRPDWYVDAGWALTPEAAGVADRDGRTPAEGPIHGWVRSDVLGGGALMIGGRNFDPAAPSRVTIGIGDLWSRTFTAAPGFFLRSWRLLRDGVATSSTAYQPVTVTVDGGARVAVEQFDASATRTIFGYGDGWNEQEYNPETGLRWRWLSERGDLQVDWRGSAAILHLDGESPRRYFSHGSTVTILADGRPIFEQVLSSDFSLHVPIAQPVKTITVRSDQFYVPAERTRRSRDRRHLALRIFNCQIVPASAPGR